MQLHPFWKWNRGGSCRIWKLRSTCLTRRSLPLSFSSSSEDNTRPKEIKKSMSCHQRKVRFNLRSPVPPLMHYRILLGKLSLYFNKFNCMNDTPTFDVHCTDIFGMLRHVGSWLLCNEHRFISYLNTSRRPCTWSGRSGPWSHVLLYCLIVPAKMCREALHFIAILELEMIPYYFMRMSCTWLPQYM